MVEEENEFEVDIRKPDMMSGDRIVQKLTSGRVRVIRRTSSSVRHILAGMDESHLFMSVLPTMPGPATVENAHQVLKPPDLPKDYIRKGEYFFTHATDEQLAWINTLKVKNRLSIQRFYSIGLFFGRRGNQHVVDYAIIAPTKSFDGDLVEVPQILFVKGHHRHIDHRTKFLQTWYRVWINTELANNTGARWLD